MRAQVSLTPTESKSLISKAVIKLDIVQRALNNGTVAIHPSSTTVFIMKELFGKMPDVWMLGVVLPRGTCHMGPVTEGTPESIRPADLSARAGSFRRLWVLKKGLLQTDLTLDSTVRDMGVDDVYIKAPNAIDSEGNTGVMLASEAGGSVARMMGYALGRGFNVVIPVGLEKLIPTSIREVVKETGVKKMDYAMGIPVGMYPLQGTVITEVNALEILTGATAVPIGAGGVGGAEGSVTLVIKGEAGQVKKAIEIVEAIKGLKLPEIRLPNCPCKRESCHLARARETEWKE